MQVVLRLLDADEGRRLRVMEQHQVGQHLQRAIGGKACEHRVAERRILDLEQQAAIRHRLGQHPLDTRHAPAQHLEDVLEPMGVLLSEILDDVS
eukprot:9849-Eustigmatos_ZCMA.PRE.1